MKRLILAALFVASPAMAQTAIPYDGICMVRINSGSGYAKDADCMARRAKIEADAAEKSALAVPPWTPPPPPRRVDHLRHRVEQGH